MDGNIQRYVLKLYGVHMYVQGIEDGMYVVKGSSSHGNWR